MHRKSFLVFLIGVLLGGSSIASAQAKKKAGASTDCSGAWTGTVTYSRTQTQTDNKTVERVSGRGTDTRNWEMRFEYNATVQVYEAPEKNGTSLGRASITSSLTSKETSVAVEKNSCDRGKTWQDMMGTFTIDASTTGQATVEANVYIGVNSDGTYTVSVGLPEIEGTVTGSQTSTYSGQCTPKKGKNLTIPPMPTKIQGQSLSSDGSHRINPDDPNHLSGSYTQPVFAGVVEKITWSLEKCGAPLRITDLKFEHMKFPTWDDWQEISEQAGTVDGNWVKIKATVFNASGEPKTGEVYLKETYKGDKWDGSKPDAPLKDQTFTVSLEPGEEREVEMLWDSSGYAWYDDGRPRLVQRIKAEVWENYKKADEMTRNLKVVPKPIVFVPGIWTDPEDFEYYQNLLTTTHSYGWKTYAVIDTSSQGTIAGDGATLPADGVRSRSVYDRADNLARYVDNVRGANNAWHVDMLAHSTGGLAARLYIHKTMEVLPDAYPVVKHLMMLGTPNKGLPCTDSLLYMSSFKEDPQTARQLEPEEMAIFNQYVTQRKGTKFSALVGDKIPTVCNGPNWGDLYVTVESASFGVEDVTFTGAMHKDLINTASFNDYVKPHVVTGPRGTYPLAASGK